MRVTRGADIGTALMREGRMRTMHDGILVGVGTAVADDPRLNGEL